MNRALRRHHEQRAKNRAIHQLYVDGMNYHDREIVGIHARTPKRCGKGCCSRPRKNFGEPISEMRSDIRYHQEVREFVH